LEKERDFVSLNELLSTQDFSFGRSEMNKIVVTCLASAAFAFGSPLIGTGSARAAHYASIATENPGTIIVRTHERRLYLVVAPGRSISYPVGVGRAGQQWAGESYIKSKRLKPAWSPPAVIKHDKPSIPDVIPAGSPRNPMGAAALVLADGEYAIHGTNAPSSIGGFVSYGCIRMHNKDILDLYQRVSEGTRVIVTP
jgi:lipoprotein-anchoring transpeptidase ErfK/SrfK